MDISIVKNPKPSCDTVALKEIAVRNNTELSSLLWVQFIYSLTK
jgi:hypothetical protein